MQRALFQDLRWFQTDQTPRPLVVRLKEAARGAQTGEEPFKKKKAKKKHMGWALARRMSGNPSLHAG